MVKIIVVVVVGLLLVSGGVYYVVQPTPLPTPTLEQDPEGVAQSTVNDARIVDPGWLDEDSNFLWVACRFGKANRIRCHMLINLTEKTTKALLRGANLVSWIDDHRILVYNRGNTDSIWDRLQHKIHRGESASSVTQFFILDVNTGQPRQVCSMASKQHPTFVDLSPSKTRGVVSFGPKEFFEFEVAPNVTPRKIDEEYVWAPKWIDNDTYLFVGQTSVLSRKFGESNSRSVSMALLDEVRDAISDYGSPTLKICGRVGSNLLLVDHDPELDFDRLLVLDEKTTLVEDVTRLIPSAELPRFNSDGSMMVYQGQQFDKNMDTVYLQTVEIDSEPIELVTGELGSIQESSPLFWKETSVLYVHRGVEIRSISLSDGNIELHWPIAVVP